MPDEVKDPPTMTPPVVDEPQKPANPKDFKPIKNTKLSDALLSESEIADKKSKSVEPPVAPKIVDPPVTDKPDDDFKLPDNDDPFSMDDPMIDSLVKPDDKVIVTPNKDDDITGKKDANSGLRSELKAANVRLQAKDEEFKVERQRFQDKIGEMEVSLNESSQRLAYRNPDEHPEVLAITKPWDTELDSMSKEMTLMGSDGEKLKSLAPELVRAFQAIDNGDEGDSDTRTRQLVGMIEENFPDDKKEVIRLISRGSEILTKANEKIAEVKQGGESFELGQASENYDALIEDYNKMEKEYFNPSTDLRQNDPLNPKVLLRDLIDSDSRIRDKSEKVKGFVRFAMTPLPPVDISEIEGMDEDQAAHYMQRRTGQHLAAKRRMGKMMAEALMSHAMFPVLSKDLADAQGIIKKYKEAEPRISGDDDDHGSVAPREPVEKKDIKDFSPQRSNLKF